MTHEDHVALIRAAVEAAGPGGPWADLGSGGGAFTLALADLLGPGATIYSVDRDRSSLSEQERAMRSRFPAVHVEYVHADFTRPLDLPPLDGIVSENAIEPLHRGQLFAALCIYRQCQIGAGIEAPMHFPMTTAAQRDPVASLELRIGDKRLAAYMVSREALARMAIHAPVPVALSDELAPPAKAALTRQTICKGCLERC